MKTIKLAAGELLSVNQLNRKGVLPENIVASAKEIVARVRAEGDAAVRDYCSRFDGVDLESFRLPQEQIDAALEGLDPTFVVALEKAAAQIREFHEREVEQSWFTTRADGTMLGVKVTPLAAAGIYVPGGRAQYPSTVLMNAIPAKVAGVKRVVMVTPPQKDGLISPYTLAAAKLGGVDEVIFGHFDHEMQHMDWRDFIHKLLIGRFNAGWIISGRNNRFGYKGQGNAEGMAIECEKAGIGYDCIEDVKIDGIVVSSTYIRQLISQGDMEGAAKFLGHPYTVSGIVEHGRRVGTSVLQVPTVNLRLPTEMAMPPYGVYATRVLVDGQSYIAATNIGVKPTFLDGGAPTIEPHLLDFAGDLYGKMIHVELHKFLRPEMQFESVEALKTAIEENVQQTREFFKEK